MLDNLTNHPPHSPPPKSIFQNFEVGGTHCQQLSRLCINGNLISSTGTLVAAKEEQNHSTTDNATESGYFADGETSTSSSDDEISVPDEKEKPTNHAEQGNQ